MSVYFVQMDKIFRKKILFTYQELKQEKVYLNTYILEAIISDKICRILDVDNEPRVLFDLCYLLKLGIDTLSIKEELKKRYGYNIYLPSLLSEITRDEYKRNWQIRLERQIVNLPAYEVVIKELKNLIKIKLLS